ncbi:MAG: lysophospholipid acyltransferase family protein [Neisseria sp.]|nr:lysophospholipid acyltransferase family protein [Neisseria sp.]
MSLHYRHLLNAATPSRRNRFTATLGGIMLKLLGWRIIGTLPAIEKVVVVGAPHTSNYDGVVALPAVLALDLKISLMAKHNLFYGPIAPVMRWLGLIPVERHAAGGMVGAAIEQFAAHRQLWLGIAPEGTRRGVEQWKTGFHRIALSANVPIFPVAWDYARKAIILGEAFMPSADVEHDLQKLYAFYRDKQPRHPHRLSQPLRSDRD